MSIPLIGLKAQYKSGLLGTKPVFVDIEPDTCNIDANEIEGKITSKTKAIVTVSFYCQVVEMDEINANALVCVTASYSP